MTQLDLIILLGVYAAVIALAFLTGKAVALPAEISKAKLEVEENFKKKMTFTLAFINVFEVTLGMIGFVGMLFLWNMGPFIFTAAIFFKIFLSPWSKYAWFISNKWEMMFFHLEMMLDGTILVVVFFGPARHLFFQ